MPYSWCVCVCDWFVFCIADFSRVPCTSGSGPTCANMCCPSGLGIGNILRVAFESYCSLSLQTRVLLQSLLLVCLFVCLFVFCRFFACCCRAYFTSSTDSPPASPSGCRTANGVECYDPTQRTCCMVCDARARFLLLFAHAAGGRRARLKVCCALCQTNAVL